MGLLGTLGFPLFFVSLIQISFGQQSDFRIVEITSPSASQLNVKWTLCRGATNYLLDIRIDNVFNVAPVVVMLPASTTTKLVEGVRPGTLYNVTVKAFQFYYIINSTSKLATTVPATSQIISSESVSSSTIRAQWSNATGASQYFLIAEATSSVQKVNMSFTTLNGEISNLQPSTTYNLYIYSANSAGLGAPGKVRTVTTLVQPPVGVTVQQAGPNSALLSWQPVDKVLEYGVSIYENETIKSNPVVKKTSSTSLQINNLLPCTKYLFGIGSSNNFLVFGEQTFVRYMTGSLNPVAAITTNYSCASGLVTINWGNTFGASSYRAVATPRNGTTLSCSATSTSCQITGVQCGQRYTVSVTAISGSCESSSNATAIFETVPCAPTNLGIFRDCYSNVIIFSWDPTANTMYYVAKAMDSNGEITECRTTDTSCFFTNTGCGLGYQFTVYSVNGECSSRISAPARTRTAPCDPKNVKTIGECLSDILIVSWEPAAGALSYTVEAKGNTGVRYNCSSFTTSCALSGVRCGESLSVWITASNDDCISDSALGEVAETVPCTPRNVTVDSDCSSNSFSVSWDYSRGALFYITTAEDSEGNQYNCKDTSTQCQIKNLRCGHSYSVFVIATNFMCNSSESSRITVETAPCSPESVDVFLDCAANHALIIWQNIQGRNTYTAMIEDKSGSTLNCSTLSNNCYISGLKCGQVYSVFVIQHNGKCASPPSRAIKMNSVPCGPENVKTYVNCGMGTMMVDWDIEIGAESYQTIVAAGNGESKYCSSTETNCEVRDLECGQSYTVVVMSLNGTCQSLPSRDVIVQGAPCVPQNVTAELSCSGNKAVISWEEGKGAKYYTASAVGETGHKAKCTSNNTACSIPNLLCSENYTVAVTASDNCTSLPSSIFNFQTAPCPPVNVEGWIDCTNNTAFISWDPSKNAKAYRVRAVGTSGHTSSCNSTKPNCQLRDLHCGQEYTFTVIATDGHCDSNESLPYKQETAPCAPKNVEKILYCNSNILLLYWDPSLTALNYTAAVQGPSGLAHSCNTSDTSCNFRQLQCGRQYTATVKAYNKNCSSPNSITTTVKTVPCIPQNVRGDLDHTGNFLVASWGNTSGATVYIAVVTGPDSYMETCSTANLTCTFGNLKCAEQYDITVSAGNDQCNSTQSYPASLLTAPCEPQNLNLNFDCASNIAIVSWETSIGAKTYTVLAEGQNSHLASCQTSDTFCRLSLLDCGQLYNVTVLADNGKSNSSSQTSLVLETASCAPHNVQASLVCANNTAVVSWDSSAGAESYTVTAQGWNGHTTSCSSNSTNCYISHLQCGVMYDITVIPLRDNCAGFQSSTFRFNAGPCPPSNVDGRLDCYTNIGSVSWAFDPQVEMYFATATGQDGHTHTCNSSRANCSFTDLHCGESYTITAVARERNCSSAPSSGFKIKTAPCPPRNLDGQVFCAQNIMSFMWDGITGAKSYFLSSKSLDGTITTYMTMDTSYYLSGLQCGQHYSFRVTSLDGTCNSSLSNSLELNTAPCPPRNVGANVDCGSNKVVISWDRSEDVMSYTAIAEGSHGHKTSCTTNSTSCVVKMDCGRSYIVTVLSTSATCNSSLESNIQVESAPCLPENVEAVLNCDTDVLSVKWNESVGSDLYTALAIGSDGFRASCNTTDTKCNITGLECGQTYGIAVTTSSVKCSLIKGSDYKIQSAPCPPKNTSANLNCSSNIVSVSWDRGRATELYSVTAEGRLGEIETCNTSGTNCSFTHLRCGQRYSFSVVGITNQCRSLIDSAMDLATVPCVPTNLDPRRDCDTNIVAITWDAAAGATGYIAKAESNQGHRTSCNSPDTHCSINDMKCGQEYSIVIVSMDANCASQISTPAKVATAPCPNTNLQASIDCPTNVAAISWTPGNGSDSYEALAECFSIGHRAVCNTTGSSCNISTLQCGKRYTVSVTGEGNGCRSPVGSWVAIHTAPCAPTQLRVQFSCGSDTVALSWKAAEGAGMYMALAEGKNGEKRTCNSSTTACNITSLQCGKKYNVSVIAFNGGCIGGQSEIYTIKTAPCVPKNVETHLQCDSGTLSITWQDSDGAKYYYTTAERSDGEVLTCYSKNKTNCTIPYLHCGDTYNITVTAADESCNSSHSQPKAITTAPCPPSAITHHLDCNSNIVSISWDTSILGVEYRAKATEVNGHSSSCNTSDSNCAITGLQCGKEYNVTVRATNDGCLGAQSSGYRIRTAPCTPQLTDVEIDCLSDIALLTWGQVDGAMTYIATGKDKHDRIFQCNSSDTSCSIMGFNCGQQYSFSVTAWDDLCSSEPSNVLESETAPCMPQDVRTDLPCNSSTVSVFWAPSVGALTYTATLEGRDGNTICCTTNSTTCEISDLPCGEIFFVSVTAEGPTCNSSQSTSVILKTVPCVPQHLNVSLNCENNKATLRWDESKGAQLYTVEAAVKNGHSTTCSSTENSCEFLDLRCGRTYAISVIAEDMACESEKSKAVNIKTVPCNPDNIVTKVDCETNTIAVSWNKSDGAEFYTVTAEDGDGWSTHCNGFDSQCNMTGLSCGRTYYTTVTASDDKCSSQPTSFIEARTAPCQPRDIEAFVDCYTKTAILSWNYGAGAIAYTASALTNDGLGASCNTNNTNCEISDLQCGEEYLVSVFAQDETCNSSAVLTDYLKTEPCVPQNISVRYTMSIAQLVWDPCRGALSYTAEALTSQGHQLTCNTDDTNCALAGFLCSQIYNITVTAHNEACNDTVTSEIQQLETEHCPPSAVVASVHCQTGVVSASWEESDGAEIYIATFDGRNGDSQTCQSTGTTCNVSNLQCGSIYYVSVKALSTNRNTSLSTVINVATEPCVPDHVETNVDCGTNTAWVSWMYTYGAESYLATAEGADGHVASCNTNDNTCNITDLNCGQIYNLTLTAINEQCQNKTPTVFSFSTRPCAPLRVNAELECGSDTALVFWEEREGIELYYATATSSTGHTESCNSTSTSCNIANLQCGETYYFTVTANTEQCESELSSTIEIKAAPCRPENVFAQGSCDSEDVTVAWDESEGALSYIITVTGDLGLITAFNTTETTIEFELNCGQTYNITVVGQDDRCDSISSFPAEFISAPCVPQNVDSYTHCETNRGSVSWTESDGAVFYTATAQGLDGHTHVCNTTETSCTWEDLHCGEVYTIYIIAENYMCNSSMSNTTVIYTAPCVPQNLVPELHCGYNISSVTWDVSAGAEMYVVTAQSGDGHKIEISTNDTYSDLRHLLCGEVYTITVVAYSSECKSEESTPAELTTDPCILTRVTTQLDCLSNSAVISWDEGSGAQYYTAVAETGVGLKQSCISYGRFCTINNLQCGQLYFVYVTASSNGCTSAESFQTNLLTAPCIPQNVSLQLDCVADSVLVSWEHAEDKLSFKALAQNNQGNSSSCETRGTQKECLLTNLICGLLYSVQVVAFDNTCSSLPSEIVNIQTVPCTPQISDVYVDCNTNTALIEWSYAVGAISYTAIAESGGSELAFCNTSHTNCEILDLECGRLYSLTLIASDEHCNSLQSIIWDFESVPCAPQNVISHLDCYSNFLYVEWEASSGAESYEVYAVSLQGHVATCSSTDEACEITNLMCGNTYNISVVAISQHCNISESAITEIQSVPCIPENVDGSVDCETGAVSMSWEHSEGAVSYTAVALGSGGYSAQCYTSGTTCQFTDLLCGLSYSLSVTASHDTCSSSESHTVTLSTVPCVPQNVTAQLQCANNTGWVFWELGEAVVSYEVLAIGPDGHRTQCNTTLSGCELTDLNCGQLYNLTVTSLDGVCDNIHAFSHLQTAPCEPKNVRSALECSTNSASVAWDEGNDAVSYRAVGHSSDGHTAVCNTSSNFCDLQNLQCGQKYNVSVFAVDDVCDSVQSRTSEVSTAPCAPQNVEVHIKCDSGILVVTWDSMLDITFYRAQAVAKDGNIFSCETTDTSCSMKGLLCGRTYTIQVTAFIDGCSSKPSDAVMISSAPCPPNNAIGSLDCMTNSAWVTWENSNGAQSYTVTALGSGNYNSTCKTASTTCNVPSLRCGILYTFFVTALNKNCESAQSNTFQIATAPCALTTVMAVTKCNSSTLHVTWDNTETSEMYIATAEGSDRSLLFCNSTMAACDLTNAHCGTRYTVIVAASSDKCSSLRSPPYYISTAPCAPQNVVARPNCDSQGVTVSWNSSSGALSYLLTAIGRDGDRHSCNTTQTNCPLTQLHCGQQYSLSVRAADATCASPPSSMVSFNTVPCKPNNLSVNIQCATKSAVLSWDRTNGSVGYFASASAVGGHSLFCETREPPCTIEGLECGANYSFKVLSSDGICNSSYSDPLARGAVPCPPAMVRTRLLPMHNGIQEVEVMWQKVDCAEAEYRVDLLGQIQDDELGYIQIDSYWTTFPYFYILLPCSSTYNVTLRARNSAGKSNTTDPILRQTAPCAPAGATYNGNFTSAVISWNASVHATDYKVYSVSNESRIELCRTTQLSCTVTHVQKSTIVITAINSAGESEPTREIQDSSLHRTRRDLRQTATNEEPLLTPDLHIVNVTRDSLHVEWTAVEDSTYYVLIVKEDTETHPFKPLVMSVNGTVSIVSGLQPLTRYSVIVAAKNSNRSSQYSEKVFVTTGI
nr:PREDICTED: uncharacterized protein LOC102685057 [Lepisosteus oculatus]